MDILRAWPSDRDDQLALAGEAATVLRHGGLVVFPTDTVYGLGAHPAQSTAIQRIYQVKGRPDEKAIIWLVSSIESAGEYCEVDDRVHALAARYWPGPLTLVLRRRSPTAAALPTLGVRIPGHTAALAIIAAAGGAVATTSANRSGAPSARTAAEALQQLGRQIDLVVDDGTAPGGRESTVLDLSSSEPRMLREGPVTMEDVEETLTGALPRRAGGDERNHRS